MKFKDEPWKKHQKRLYSTLQSLLTESVKIGEFPNIDPMVLFKALGGLFMGLVLMGNDKKVSKKDVEKMLNEPVDLVLMDMKMPNLDGFEATQRAKSMDICKEKN